MISIFTPQIAYAADDIASLMSKVNKVIINPLITFLFVLAFVIFIYGLVEFLGNRDNQEAQTKGKSHMLWGVIGVFIMFSVFGIMTLLINVFGLTSPNGGPVTIPEAQQQ